MAKSGRKNRMNALDRAAELQRAGRLDEAERAYRQALRKKPSSATASRGLAQLLRQTRRLDEAIDLLNQALRIKPGNPHLHNDLCATLMMAGRGDREVVEAAKRAIAEAPTSPVGYFQLAQLYRRRFEPAAAIQVLEEGLTRAGADWYLERLLAAACADYGHTERAIDLYRRVLAQDSRDPDVQTELANTLRNVGQFEEARSHYETAIRLRPGDPTTIAGLAELYESMREHERASSLVNQSIQAGDSHPEIIFAYARVCRRSNNPAAAIPMLEQLARRPDVITAARAQANMMLGALYEDQGQYDLAFDRYRVGNELQASARSFDSSSVATTVDALIDVFSASATRGYPRSSERSDLPVFIVGMPRTGTSLVEQILASHPAVHGAGERHDISTVGFEIPNRVSGDAGTYPHCIRELTQEIIDELAGEYLKKLQGLAPEARHVIDKNPFNFLNLGLISLLTPGARVIHCTRDPMDTCFSIYATRFSAKNDYSNRLEDISEFYRQYLRLMAHWPDALSLEMMDVSYEALIDDLEGITRTMLDFLGLEFDERCLRFHESDRFTRTLSTDQVRRPIYRSSVGRHKAFEAHLGPLKAALGESA